MRAGRKSIYPTSILLTIMEEFVRDNPFEQLSPTRLARGTGIPYHIWRDNLIVRKEMEALNTPPILADSSSLELLYPSAEDFVNRNYKSRDKLIRGYSQIMELLQSLSDKAQRGYLELGIEKSLQQKIFELEAKLRIRDNQIKALESEIDSLYIKSESPTIRQKEKLKDNLITLTPNNIKQLSKDMKELKEEFSALFE